MKTKLDIILMELHRAKKLSVNEMVVISSAVYAWEPTPALPVYQEVQKELIEEKYDD